MATGKEFLQTQNSCVRTVDYPTRRHMMLHPNEVKMTPDNLPNLMKMATKLSGQHVEALKEQIIRQEMLYAIPKEILDLTAQ